jgi:hypothetical protein
MRLHPVLSLAVIFGSMAGLTSSRADDTLNLQLRYQAETSLRSGRFHVLTRD